MATPLRRPPRGLARVLVRLPLWLYRARLGWLVGGRFIRLGHLGRRTGASREAVLEVIHRDPGVGVRDPGAGVWYVASGWGERSEWLRNVEHDPRVTVTAGRRTLPALAERLPKEEAEAVLREYAQGHRLAAAGMARLFGSSDPGSLAEALPVVALRPRR